MIDAWKEPILDPKKLRFWIIMGLCVAGIVAAVVYAGLNTVVG